MSPSDATLPADVPTPIDFRRPDHARAWAESANVIRPWRFEVFARMVDELRSFVPDPVPSILELGSGPGYLAEIVLEAVPDARYTLLDFSDEMHTLARARLGDATAARFVAADFKADGWDAGLGRFDAVLTMQAVHELRHKSRAPRLHEAVHGLLVPRGIYLVGDHVFDPLQMSNPELYMTDTEQIAALHSAGFEEVSPVMSIHTLRLLRARRTRP